MNVTENVTLLFTDVVGSTELATSLAPDVADSVRRDHFAALRQSIAAAGGTEVKNLGDGLMVVFPTASAGLACAVSMQQAVDRANRTDGRSVGLRIGLSAGEVSREEDGDCFGDPVVEAARLCAHAEGGQILASDVVRLLGGRRSTQRCTAVGPVQLKGLAGPVETVEVGWDPLDTPDVLPLPAHLVPQAGAPVVSRETQLEKLAEALRRVADGGGREILLITGEAGLGKTTLMAEAARAAFDDGAYVLFGHCEENLATPYQLFAEAIGHYVTYAAGEQLVANVEAHGPELVRLAPALASRMPELAVSRATDAETERFLLFAAVVELLASVSADRPVVLVFDDLQWADDGSLLLLRHVSEASRAMRVLILGTFRNTELSLSLPLLDTMADIRRHGGISRIELSGLDATGVTALMEAAAGHSLDGEAASLAAAVYRETDGNPFFVTEILRHLRETGAIYRDATGRWHPDPSVSMATLPDSVREVVHARVRRLGPDAERVLSLAAVMGRDFDFDLLVRASGASEDELLDILDAAEAVALVRELGDSPGRFSFAHALIQHTLYESLGRTRRSRAHLVVATALEDLAGTRVGTRAGELARHWLGTNRADDVAKAIGYGRQAGDAALAALAPADALRYYSQALDLYVRSEGLDPLLGVDLGIGVGIAQRQTGDPAFRRTLLDAVAMAGDLGDAARMATAALANTRGYYSAAGEVDLERVHSLEATLDQLGDDDRRLRARLLATLCSEVVFHRPMAERRDLADRAKTEAASRDDAATLVDVHNMVAEALRHPKYLPERMADTERALALADELDDPTARFWAVSHRMRAVMEAGMVDEARHLAKRMSTVADEVGQPVMRWMTLYTDAQWSFLRGETADGEQKAEQALALGTEIGQPDALPYYATQLSHARWQQGRLAELVDLIEAGARDNPGIPAYSGALARALCQAGQDDAARAVLDKAVSDRFADLPEDLLWSYGMVTFAEAATGLGHLDAAGLLHDQLAPFEDQLCFLGTTCEGPIAHYLGALAVVLLRFDAAERHLQVAAVLAEATGSPFFAARTAIERGRLAARRGDARTARTYVADGLGLAVRGGFTGEIRRADAVLAEIG